MHILGPPLPRSESFVWLAGKLLEFTISSGVGLVLTGKFAYFDNALFNMKGSFYENVCFSGLVWS